MNRRLFLGIGFAIWLVATIVVRLAGQRFFLTDNSVVMIVIWALTAVALFIVAQAIFRWRNLPQNERYLAAILLVLPGQLIDGLVVNAFVDVFPNMPAVAAGPFGAWLLLAYGVVLVAGVIKV